MMASDTVQRCLEIKIQTVAPMCLLIDFQFSHTKTIEQSTSAFKRNICILFMYSVYVV